MAVGAGVPDRPTLDSATFTIPMDVVARPAAFPGATARRPLLVVDAERYLEAANRDAQSSIDPRLLFEPFLWVRGSATDITAGLAVSTGPTSTRCSRRCRPRRCSARTGPSS